MVVTDFPRTVPCIRCGFDDRMRELEAVETDFGGYVKCYVCQRCGVAAVSTIGERPEDYYG